jgi:lysophospholipase L1-like esterase
VPAAGGITSCADGGGVVSSLIFSDAFTRANGSVGNSWEGATSAWSIASNALTTNSTSMAGDALVRPTAETAGSGYRVRIAFVAQADSTAAIAMRTTAGGEFYCCEATAGVSTITPRVRRTLSTTLQVPNVASGSSQGTAVAITCRVFAANGTTLLTSATGEDNIAAHQSSGLRYGVGAARGITAPLVFDNFELYDQGGPPSPGTVTVTSNTSAGVGLSASATGGTGTLTYQWHRSTESGFTPGVGTAISGATSTTYTDSTGIPGVVYYYACAVTDSLSQSASTPQIAVAKLRSAIRIGLIGDSNFRDSYGGDEIIAAITDEATPQGRSYIVTNQAAGGTYASGTATESWHPSASGGRLGTAITAFLAAGVSHVVVMLGTNDVRVASANAATYGAALEDIVDVLVDNGFVVVLEYPASFQVTGGSQSHANLNTLRAYQAEIDSLADGVNVFVGSGQAWRYTAVNDTTAFSDGLHFTGETGTVIGKAMRSRLSEVMSGEQASSLSQESIDAIQAAAAAAINAAGGVLDAQNTRAV